MIIGVRNITDSTPSHARFRWREFLSRFEPVAREQLKQVVTNRVSQFFNVDSYKVEGKDPLVGQVPRRAGNLRRQDGNREKALPVSTYPPPY